jgi:glutathionylspermidine synthase
MKLVKIPENKYEEYRLNAMFDCYKWDPQFYDSNTVAKYALVLTQKENKELIKLTEDIDKETRLAEEYINQNLNHKIANELKLPKKIYNLLCDMKDYNPDKNIRLNRYDFHPDVNGKWVVTEVNSDVPGGFAESSLLPDLARKYIDTNLTFNSFGDNMANAITNKVPLGSTIMMVHCTCYSDDRQVMQYMGDKLSKLGYNIIYGAADHINFIDRKAYSILSGNEKEVNLIFRFTPIEWLISMKPRRWDGYFNTTASQCNHPIAVYAQTKRFPLVWDTLEKAGIDMSTWKSLLPETKVIKQVVEYDDYIYKPVYGRVGERISIKEACKEDEYKKIMRDVKLHKNNYLLQKKFKSNPIKDEEGNEYHLCLGSYAIDGKHSGFYARISNVPRIDSHAADIPVLIEK